MTNRRFFIALVLFFFSMITSCCCAGEIENNPARSRFYVEMALGQQNVRASSVQTAIPSDVFIPYDRKDIMGRTGLGYILFPFFSVETGMTFYSGYGYVVSSNENTINRSLYAFDFLLEPMISYHRLHFYVMGGPALVYSGVGGFHINGAEISSNTETGEVDAHWQNTSFIRPEAGAGVSVDITSQIRLGVGFSRIFGTGSFGSSVELNQYQAPELIINNNYLPNIDYVAATIFFVL